jgi:hypothetical protein
MERSEENFHSLREGKRSIGGSTGLLRAYAALAILSEAAVSLLA